MTTVLNGASLASASPTGRRGRLNPLSQLVRWPSKHPDLAILALLLVVAALLRAAFLLRATVFIIADSENYFLPAYRLAHGQGFDLEARRAPLYPVFIAAVIRAIGQDLAALALAQHLLGLITTGLTYGLARVTFGRTAGLLASLPVALNGSLLISEQTVSSEALFTSLLLLAALLGVLGLRGGPPWLYLAGGALLALAGLVRPVGFALLPVLPLALLASRPDWRRLLASSSLYLVGFALVLLPWMARNYLTFQVFSTEGAFGQTLVGRTVRHDRSFVFIDPRAAPDPDTRRQRARELMQEAADQGSFITPLRRRLMRELGWSELEANRLMRDLAVEAILRMPAYYVLGSEQFFVQLAIGQSDPLREHWRSRREAEAREEWESHPEIAGLLGPPNPIQERRFAQAERLAALYQPGRHGAVLLAFFALGLIASVVGRQAWRPALLPALWAIALLLVGAALVGPVLRYRYPAEPFLSVLAAGGIVALLSFAQERRRQRGR